MKLKSTIRNTVLVVLLCALMYGSSKAALDPVAVIVNKDNPIDSAAIAMLKKMYSNDLLRWPNGVPIILYDLDVTDPVRKTFSLDVLGRLPEKIAEDWAHKKITNQALNPPHTLKSQRLVIRRVSMQRGAVGYVSLSRTKNRSDIKVLVILK